MSTVITIDTKVLDPASHIGVVSLACEAIAYFAPKSALPEDEDDDPEAGKPVYAIFKDTSAYDALFEETTRNFDPISDWGEELEKRYQTDPSLKSRLSVEAQYQVPANLLKIPHETGGGHGDLRLRFRCATIAFFPMTDYTRFFEKDESFHDESAWLLIDGRFKKGDPLLAGQAGLEISCVQ